jgi:outer membrane protein OmpA-like peptidoglycan-associated protein
MSLFFVNFLKLNQFFNRFTVVVGFVCLLFLPTTIEAQPPKIIKKSELARRNLDKYDKANQVAPVYPDEAYMLYSDVLRAEPTFQDGWLQYGGVLYDNQQYSQSIGAFRKVVELDSTNYPAALFFMSKAEIATARYQDAVKHLEQLERHPQFPTGPYASKAKQLLAQAQSAQLLAANPVEFKPEALPEGINTLEQEYLPSLSADGQTLIFCRRGRDEDFYESRFVNGVWQKAVAIDSLNTDENEAAETISADGKSIIFTRCGASTSCDLYLTQFKNGKWNRPAKLAAPLNTNMWESQPTLSPNGRLLFFTSNRPGGFGGADIWVSKLDGKGFGEPVNLGTSINTAGEEITPFIHIDGSTFYYASDGMPGMGQLDLYVCQLLDESKLTFSAPVNLGFPINTSGDESGIAVSRDGARAIMTRNASTGKSNYDLFWFDLPQGARAKATTYVRIEVVDAETGQPLRALIELAQSSDGKSLYQAPARADGTALACLPLEGRFSLQISQPGYLFHSEYFEPTGQASLDNPYLLKVKLQQIHAGQSTTTPTTTPAEPVVLRNVFFDTGSAILRPESSYELNRLATLLKENASLRVEIRGHTDNVGSDENNLLLSSTRAESVVKYLAAQGIAADRLRSQGLGESLPIANNDTNEGRQSNRRTEFVVW